MIAPENIRDCWTRVKAGLERVLEVSSETWIPEDIYVHLRMKLATLYLAFDGDVYRGFFVTEVKRDPFTNEPYINIWILHGEPTKGEHFADVGAFVEETLGFIDGLASGNGYRLIRMSGREGWKRYLRGHFKPTRICYERQLRGVQP
jgi:hypothetical protein